jgi:hypothetical protein
VHGVMTYAYANCGWHPTVQESEGIADRFHWPKPLACPPDSE